MNEILVENVSNKELVLTLQKNCQKYLSEVHDLDGNRLRRGMKFNEPFRKMNAVGDGRNETMHDEEWEHIADQWFLKQFGFKARSESVYCSGGTKMAKRYGLVYSVFPIGNYEYVWSPVVDDLYYPYKRSGGKIEAVQEALDSGQYTTTNLNAGLDKQSHEIMVHCPNGYYAVRDDLFDHIMFTMRPFR